MLKTAFAIATLGAAVSLPVVATAQPAGTDTPVQADPNSESGASYRATDLLNSNVRGEDGQVIAKVEDFVLDGESNQLQYVVLAYGNAAAEDAQYHVVPASQFFVQRDADVLYLQTPLTVEVLKRAPAIPRARWATVVRQPNWSVGVNRFWTGVGVNLSGNRGFGRRGQINAINLDVLDGRPGVPGPGATVPRVGNPPGPAGGPGVGPRNPPGPAGGPGVGPRNPPGPAGGPGVGPRNPPGPAGGPGVGPRNPPGPAGGPGAGPNRDGGPNLPGPR